MNEQKLPFVPRDGYRLRRAKDMARLLPLLGAILVLMPLLWTGLSTRSGIIYIFVVWLGLIFAALLLSRILKDTGKEPGEAEPERPSDGAI